ncbi:hypothetical protein CEQ90_13325 [Lewinellaceae bacterium SD302]|nr:hypothetical protein CEQ90_13325 [Lewinellaceae bacterium SD302]
MPQLRALFCFIFFLTMTGLSAQSAITANLNVTGGSATLEGYTDPGKTFITLLSTDAVPIFEARLEIRLSVGQRTYVLNRNGEAGTISLVSNVPTLLQGLDLAEYFTPNALDPFQRQQLLDDGGLLPDGQVSVCVALYDIRFPGAPPASNNACALAYFEYAQPPLLIDQPDPVAHSIPQAINFQWIPQQFFPASYTIEIWDAQPDLGFGQLFIVNNTPPLVQETVVSSQFVLTDFYPLLSPQTDYIWRVRAEDLVQNRPFINDGFSELGFFRIASDVVANGCYSIEDLTIEGGVENPLVISYSAATEAFNNAHSIEVRDPVTGLLLIELDIDSGILLPSNHRGVQAWTSGPITEIEPTTLPLRIEICVSCDNGVDEICEVVVYEGPPSNIDIFNDGNPCPPPVDNLSWVLASENSVSLSWTPEPTATGYTIDVRNLSIPPTTASDAPPEIFYETEQPLENLTPGDQYRVVVCYQCSDTGEDRCATIYFVLPDLADCNPVLSPVDIAVTPTTAGFSWDVDSEWVDGYSLRVGADSVTIPVGQNSYLWEGLNEGTAYAAELCVYCPGGDNTFRNCVNVSFTTPQFICADEPMLDQGLSISSQASGGILVDWSGLPAEVAVQGGIVTLTNTATLLTISSHTVEDNQSFHVFEAPETEPPYLVRFCLECEGQTACYEQEIIPPGCDDLTISGLNAAEIGSDFVQLYWAGPNGFAVDEYRLRKRLTEGDDTDFEPLGTSTESQFRVEGLLPLRTYEIEICFACDAENQRCDTLEITTEAINCSQAAEEPVAYACGSEADIPEFGQVPLVSHLSPGDSVVAGDFIVLITNVESTGSPWRGSGRIMVPYLNEVELSVDFEAIEVNENCRMTSGEMIVKPPFANLLEDLGDMIDDVTDVLGSVDDILGDILDILGAGGAAADYLGPILEILEVLEEQLDNNPFISPEAESLLEDAILCLQSSIATGNPAACTEILEELQEVLAETYAADYQVPFHRAEGQVYGYDTLSYPEMDILNWYPSIPPIGGRPYTGAWVSMPEGTGDKTRAVRVPSGSLDSIQFFGTDSTEIAATITNEGFDLMTDEAASPVIYAVHPKADSTGEMSAKIAGQLSLVAYQQKYLNVVLVPVNGANAGINAAEVEVELQRIFGPAVVEVSVSADNNLPVPGVGIIPDIASGVRQYPAALRQIINTYEDERPVVDETYYIFLVEEGENERTGFMPRKKQFGFLFLNRINDAPDPPGENLSASAKVARLAGHELGHGAYHLRHTFEEVGELDAGDTDNLMDYALGGRLHKWQWDFVEDPVGVVGVFEGDDGGSGGVVETALDLAEELIYGSVEGLPTENPECYYTPDNKIFCLPIGAKPYVAVCNNTALPIPIGALVGYSSGGVYYTSTYFLGDSSFVGYKQVVGGELYGEYQNNTYPNDGPEVEVYFHLLNSAETDGSQSISKVFKVENVDELGLSNGQANSGVGGVPMVASLALGNYLTLGVTIPYTGNCGYPTTPNVESQSINICDGIDGNDNISSEYITELAEKISDAVERRSGPIASTLIRDKERYYHVNATEGVSQIMLEEREIEFFEEQFYLYKHKTGNELVVIFQQVNELPTRQAATSALDDAIQQAGVLASDGMYIYLPYTVMQGAPDCANFAYRVLGSARVGEIDLEQPQGLNNAKEIITYLFAQILKPVNLVNILLLSSGSFQYYSVESDSVIGLPYINNVALLLSKEIAFQSSLPDCSAFVAGEDTKYIPEAWSEYLNCKENFDQQKLNSEQRELDFLNDLYNADNVEAKIALLASDNWTQALQNIELRPGYIENKDVLLSYIDFSELSNWSVFAANLDYHRNHTFDPDYAFNATHHAYTNIDAFSVIDPLVYGAGDLLSLVPVVGDVTDGVLFVYAAMRRDELNTVLYGASFMAFGGLAYIVSPSTLRRYVAVARLGDDEVYRYVAVRLEDVNQTTDRVRYSMLTDDFDEAQAILQANMDGGYVVPPGMRLPTDDIYENASLNLPKSTPEERLYSSRISSEIGTHALSIKDDLVPLHRDILLGMPDAENRIAFLKQLEKLKEEGLHDDFVADFTDAGEELINFFRGPPPGRVRAWDVLSGDGSNSYQIYRSQISNLNKVDEYLDYNPSRSEALKNEFVEAVNKDAFIEGFIGGPVMKTELEELNNLYYLQAGTYDDGTGGTITSLQLDRIDELESQLGSYEHPNSLETESPQFIPNTSNLPQGAPDDFWADVKVANGKIEGLIPGKRYDYVITYPFDDSSPELRLGLGHYLISGGASGVKGAGSLRFNADGKIYYINRQSGHYISMPISKLPQELDEIVDILQQNNLTTSDVEIHYGLN